MEGRIGRNARQRDDGSTGGRRDGEETLALKTRSVETRDAWWCFGGSSFPLCSAAAGRRWLVTRKEGGGEREGRMCANRGVVTGGALLHAMRKDDANEHGCARACLAAAAAAKSAATIWQARWGSGVTQV